MKLRCGVASAVCGLVLWGHLTVLGAKEAAHPHPSEKRPVFTVEALPADPDHAHDEDRAFVSLQGRKATYRVVGEARFWNADDSAGFWPRDDSQTFWPTVYAPTES